MWAPPTWNAGFLSSNRSAQPANLETKPNHICKQNCNNSGSHRSPRYKRSVQISVTGNESGDQLRELHHLHQLVSTVLSQYSYNCQCHFAVSRHLHRAESALQREKKVPQLWWVSLLQRENKWMFRFWAFSPQEKRKLYTGKLLETLARRMNGVNLCSLQWNSCCFWNFLHRVKMILGWKPGAEHVSPGHQWCNFCCVTKLVLPWQSGDTVIFMLKWNPA